MIILNTNPKQWVFLALTVLMGATRFHHFGSVNFLPDASLAVFFLAGYYLSLPSMAKSQGQWLNNRNIVFTGFVLLAGGIDFIAIRYGGVSDWCVTPAYLFLLPTYAVVFFAGCLGAGLDLTRKTNRIMLFAIFIASLSLAFLLSNASFYLFSGRYAQMGAWSYTQQVSGYYPPYVLYPVLYATLAGLIHIGLYKSVHRFGADRQDRPI